MSYTHIHRQFWREGEGWVDHVLIHRDELVGPAKPTRWRWRTITVTETAGDWIEGKP